jgi:hypothetical protein
VWAFQDWVLRKCGGEVGGMSLPVVEGHTNGAAKK